MKEEKQAVNVKIGIKRKWVVLSIVLLGFISPFVGYLVIIEMFYLIAPFAIISIFLFVYLIVSIFNKKLNSGKSLYFFLLIPTFVLAQVLSCFIVNKIQFERSQSVIKLIEERKKTDGNIPQSLDTGWGISFKKSKREGEYEISYSRGFMVTEKYDSATKKWDSYGWND